MYRFFELYCRKIFFRKRENSMKDCILCALDEVNHFEWRAGAQRYGSHNHQHLSNYRDMILAKFSGLQNVSSCPVHKSLDPVSIKFWEDSAKFINYANEAKDFFDKIEHIYYCWNAGDVVQATTELGALVDEIVKQGADEANSKDLPLFLFRERTDGETSKDGLWHIPFEDRYKVKNYRFSISGRPMLYLGSSIVDIVYEMRQEETKDKSKHMVSTFLRKKDLKIYDLTNEMPTFVHTVWGLAEAGGRIDFDDPRYGLISKFPIYLKKLLLMSCCSFKTMREGATFHEEYILPQLLTEVLQKKGYDGIRYSSTRMNPKLFNKDKDYFWHENYFRENYVLFTKYSDRQRHDLTLKNKFANSSPMSLSLAIEDDAFDRLKELKKEIISFTKTNGLIQGLPQNIALQTLISYEVRMDKLEYEKNLYHKTLYGKFEINSIIDAYKDYIKELMNINSAYKPLYDKICVI